MGIVVHEEYIFPSIFFFSANAETVPQKFQSHTMSIMSTVVGVHSTWSLTLFYEYIFHYIAQFTHGVMHSAQCTVDMRMHGGG
jgi:hypothetical protein